MNGRTTLTLRSARLPGRAGLADIAICDGVITGVGSNEGHPPMDGTAGELDLGGRLVLPAFVDGHVHLDKTFLGCDWQPHRPGASLAERIAAEKDQRAGLTVPLPERAAALLDRMLAFGTVALRCHVDIDETLGLSQLEALLAVRETYRDRMRIDFVAFPQSGLSDRVADLMDAALRSGASVVGGLDPAGIDGAIDRHLDIVFGLAERHGCRVDIHLHDPGTLGTFELRQISRRTKALGMQGRVAVSHAFALGMVDEGELVRTAGALAEGGIAIMTNGPGTDAIPPVKRLLEEGVTVFAGSDNIRDAWSPYGDGDLLARAALIGYRADLRQDADLEKAFALVTANSRRVLGLTPVDLAVGAPADLVALAASGIPEAVAAHPADRIVIRAGVVVSGAASDR